MRLLAYVVDIDRIRAIEVVAGSSIEHDFGPSAAILDDHDELVRDLASPAALSQPTVPTLERFAAGWGRRLLPPAWLSGPPRTAVIVPNSFLHGLPFHLIRTESGNPLCVESAVSISSSLTLLERCLARSEHRASGRIDPFLHGGVRSGSRFLLAGVDALGHSDAAWRALPLDLLRACGEDPETSAQNVRHLSMRDMLLQAMSGRAYEMAIIAAHGYGDTTDAFGSGLVAAANTWGFVGRPISVLGSAVDADGVRLMTQDLPHYPVPSELSPSMPSEMLTLRDLERSAHLSCPLVALLGCSTARPFLHPGDQPVSIADLILKIGASAVVAPLWDVTLTAVSAWMTTFLVAWRRTGLSLGEASRTACKERHDAGAPLHETGCLVLHGNFR
ncbi:CHAT domain-containing protein [Kitasatospora phosalacinea]|uniref:CHAT domain-containing protein n=1 Tax=Kitasatospora phosalacinea TaxID=2065 RepID=UPI00364688D4